MARQIKLFIGLSVNYFNACNRSTQGDLSPCRSCLCAPRAQRVVGAGGWEPALLGCESFPLSEDLFPQHLGPPNLRKGMGSFRSGQAEPGARSQMRQWEGTCQQRRWPDLHPAFHSSSALLERGEGCYYMIPES